MKLNIKSTFITMIFLISIMFLSGYDTNTTNKSIDRVINQNKLSKNSIISVSIRDLQTGKALYQRDADLLLHPASTMKALTSPVILNTLGNNYNLSTGIYKDSRGFIYLKLSGDPMLKSEELSKLIATLKSKGYNNIKDSLYIDDTAIDDISWGTGWMWDDENNPYMPKYNAYNLNRNLITIKIIPTSQNQKPKVVISPYYPIKIINNAITSNTNSISAERKVWKSPDAVYISGKISSATEIKLPVANPENLFKYQLQKFIKDNKIHFSGNFKKQKLPQNTILISQIQHNLIEEITILNKQSDNLAAESLFKLAGGKYAGTTGSTANGIKAFNNFYQKLGLNPLEISIADASGVSQNDLLTTHWMTLALTKLYKTNNFAIYKNTLATPSGKGTLQSRLLPLKGKLSAKTGTNAGVSSITGYLSDKSGKTYAFSIIIQNFKGSSKSAKELEDSILLLLK